MAVTNRALKGLGQCQHQAFCSATVRAFSTFPCNLRPLETAPPSSDPLPPPQSSGNNSSTPAAPSNLPNPNLASSPRSERRLLRAGIEPVSSRRRRAVLASLGSNAIPFEQLPYQCFQEARKILLDDRQKIISDIERQRGKLERLRAIEVQDGSVREQSLKKRRVDSLVQEIEHLKILADINDPLVKMRFEDGMGDMSKPIYRHYAQKKWHKLKRLIDIQRIEQFKLTPDLLMKLDPVVDIRFDYGGSTIEGGAFLPSTTTEAGPPDMTIQSFDRGSRLLTIAVIDPDVPDVDTNGFNFRLHYLASNISIDAASPQVSLRSSDMTQHVSVPWLAPWAQKGSPYHRMVIVVLEQEGETSIEKLRTAYLNKRKGFTLRSFLDKTGMECIGATLFRTRWDEGMDTVMRRLGVEETEMELKRKRVQPLPYSWKPRDGKRYR